MEAMNQSQSGGSTFVLKHAAVRQNRTYDYIYGSNLNCIIFESDYLFSYLNIFRQKLPFIK